MTPIEQAIESLTMARNHMRPTVNAETIAKMDDAITSLQSMQGEAVGEVVTHSVGVYHPYQTAKFNRQLPDGAKLYTQPQSPVVVEWKLTENELPPEGVPVIGFRAAWVDDDFNPDGIRDCFRFGDGNDWNSSWWNDPCDQYETEAGRTGHHGAPTHWLPRPSSAVLLAASGKGE